MTGRLTRTFVAGILAATCIGITTWAVGDERSETEAMLAQAQRAEKAATSDYVAKANMALERATRLHGANDDSHARIAEGLARSWAEAARDLARAIESEREAARIRKDALDAGTQLERGRAVHDEEIARAERLKVEVEKAEHETRDGGARKPPKLQKIGGVP